MRENCNICTHHTDIFVLLCRLLLPSASLNIKYFLDLIFSTQITIYDKFKYWKLLSNTDGHVNFIINSVSHWTYRYSGFVSCRIMWTNDARDHLTASTHEFTIHVEVNEWPHFLLDFQTIRSLKATYEITLSDIMKFKPFSSTREGHIPRTMAAVESSLQHILTTILILENHYKVLEYSC